MYSRCVTPNNRNSGNGGDLNLSFVIDFNVRGMIHCDQLHLIEIGNFAQFFGDADFIFAVLRHACFPGDLHILVVIDREVIAVAGAGPSGATPKTSVRKWNLVPFQVKIIGQEPDSRCASL